MITLRKRGAVAAALALAVLVGFAVSPAETADALESETEASGFEGVSAAEEGASAADGVVEPPDAQAPAPGEAVAPEVLREPGALPQEDAEKLPSPGTPGVYGLTWSVVNEAGATLAGATVNLEGPRTSSSNTWAPWMASRTVTDCTGAPCPANSMDQDPRPGVFTIDRLVTRNSITHLTEAATRQRFRITPLQAPDGHMWDSGATLEIPQQSAAQPWIPSPSPWASPRYDFGELRVTAPALSCDADNVYSISSRGQLKHIKVDPGRAGGSVTNLGAQAPGPGVGNYNGLAISSDGSEVYAYNRGAFGGRVFRYDVARASWQFTGMEVDVASDELMLIAGAMDPEGTYWVGGYRGTSGLSLWAMNADSTRMEPRGRVDLSQWASANANGDFAFDALGNLFIVRGLNVGHDLDIFRVDAEDLAAGRGSDVIPVSAKLPTAESPFLGVSGIAYDPRGVLFLGALEGLGFVTLPLSPTPPRQLALRGEDIDSTDLATCGFPPTVRLQKDLPDGRATASDQFSLELSSDGQVIGTSQTTGNAAGIQHDAVGPIPVTSGTRVALAEAAVGQTRLGGYATSWECVADGERVAGGVGPIGSVTIPEMPRGGEVLCTLKNTIAKAQKTATPATGTAVDESTVVRYELTVDNTAGEGPVDVDYWDALTDVLDDAVFADAAGAPTASLRPDVVTSGGIVYSASADWDAQSQWLRMRGSVAPGAIGTLSFAVLVHPNSVGAEDGRASDTTEGYRLRNWLVPGDGTETPPVRPADCEPGMCTEHPVKAWTVSKGSVPEDGATLSKGGNVHYRLVAEKTNEETPLTGLVLQDDLTHVFNTAGWAPEAQAPAHAKARGLYLLNASGRSVGLDGAPNTGSPDEFLAVREVGPPERRNVSAEGEEEDLRWILTSGTPLDLPMEAQRAELWFAVQAGESPAGIPDPASWTPEGKQPVTGWRFVNYATGIANNGTANFAPNACVTGADIPDTGLAPDATQPADPEFPERCVVEHQFSQNSFVLRKDVGGRGVSGLTGDPSWGSDPTGLWNMVGQVFEVRDSASGKPSAHPSVRLCRTDYDPASGWDGSWISPAEAADSSRWDFGDANSTTQRGILDWNNSHPDDTRPVCGTLSEITAGEQQGRWRAEGLGEGNYWLVETRAPNAQVNPETLERRDVRGVQRLAEAVPFTVWPEAAAQDPGGGAQGGQRGRGQIDVGLGPSQFVDRCDPSHWVADRPTACVDRTGYFVVVQDQSPAALPFTGGRWIGSLLGAGALVLLVALATAMWWRRDMKTRGGVA